MPKISSVGLLALLPFAAVGLPARAQPVGPPQSDTQFYAYCSSPPGYYPYVSTCKVPWRKVAIAKPVDQGQPIPLTDGQPADHPATQREETPEPSPSPSVPAPSVEQDKAPAAIPAPPHPMQQAPQPRQQSTPPVRVTVESPTQPRASAPEPKQYEFAGYLVAPVFLILALVPLYLTNRRDPNRSPSEEVIRSMRLWPRRRNYFWTIGTAAVLLSFRFSPPQPILIAGVAAAGAVLLMFARTRIRDNDAPTGSPFPEAARQIASLRSVEHHNHFQRLELRWNSKFQGISSANPFLTIFNYSRVLLLTPARYWVRIGPTYSTGATQSIRVRAFDYKITTDHPLSDDIVHGTTWRHTTKAGQRDLRYRDNPQTFLVVRFGIEITLFDDLTIDLAGMTKPNCDQTVAAFNSFLVRREKTYSDARATPAAAPPPQA